MARQPLLPKSTINPVGQVARVRKASKALSRYLSGVQSWLLKELASIETTAITVNAVRYDYLISAADLTRITSELSRQLMVEAPARALAGQVAGAYEEGTALTNRNLLGITSDYTRTITDVLVGQPYQKRVALVSARVFEEMAGFSGKTAQELSRSLRDSMENGLSPVDAARDLRERFAISKRRAETIARTEITGALRRGRWDEARDAQERLGIQTGLLWVSALSSTTRPEHARLHGKVMTVEEVREFYSRDANGINCLCTQVEIVLEGGEPNQPKLIDKLKQQREEFAPEE